MKLPNSTEIEKALAANDSAKIETMLDKGLAAGWQDAAGNTLLHHAARMGDNLLTDKLLAKGAKAGVRNAHLETPAEIAAQWGHDALALQLRARVWAESKAAPSVTPLDYKSLQDIRDAGFSTGADQFNFLARSGRFAEVIKLAAMDADGFNAADLLGKGPDGDRTILKLCEADLLQSLIDPKLWARKAEDFQNVWNHVPEKYREGHDIEAFMNEMRQARLQSYAKPKFGGLKPK